MEMTHLQWEVYTETVPYAMHLNEKRTFSLNSVSAYRVVEVPQRRDSFEVVLDHRKSSRSARQS